MQNKGIVIVTAVLLTLASIFYLSFSLASSYYDKKAAEIKDPIAQQDYKDSVKYLGIYSYQNCWSSLLSTAQWQRPQRVCDLAHFACNT